MSIALVTGSNGLVGSETSIFLLNKGFIVLGIDNNQRKKFFGQDGDTKRIKNYLCTNFKNYIHFDLDIRNKNKLQKIFQKYNKDIKFILHAAAQPSHDWAYNNYTEDFQINAIGTYNMLELTKKYNPKAAFIFTSTNKVYGDNPNKINFTESKTRWLPKHKIKFRFGIDEKMPLDNCTHSFFGLSKTYADLLVQEFKNNFGLKTVCFRAGCITGPNHSGAKLHGFLSYLVKECIRNRSYNIIGYKGKQVRDNIHSNDLCEAFWNFYKKPSNESIFNIGGGLISNCSILEAIKIIQEKLSIKIKITYNKKERTGDHKWYISNINKFCKSYPKFKIKYNTEKILEEIIYHNLKT